MRLKRILIVEDEAPMRESIQDYLDDAGFQVLGVDSGQAALEVLETETIDLVLCDIHMPGMDGVDVLRSIFATNPRQAVVMVSGTSDHSKRQECLDLGARDFISKPIPDLDVIQRVIREVDLRTRLLF